MSTDDSHGKSQTEIPDPPEGKGYWAAHVGGMCAIVFSMAAGYMTAPLMNGRFSLQAGAALLCAGFAANKLAKMAGHAAASEMKDPVDARKMGNFARSMILFTSIAAGFATFAVTAEVEKYRIQNHDGAAAQKLQSAPSGGTAVPPKATP